ncbi:hypothetical protein [Nocardioides pinisoli]|uniref:WD40 repeat domain-containing protein n=1 Tax=Nocardioides pinisoli TaxID=2950279 RepID=A0ABT1L2M8_9ACTN|nr:hypothetical protein [Nocardioides pinisoli]MCP3424122.1 hypothetical protein [Nocardioides pinisoli]
MSTDLREELDALARTQSFSPDPSVWDRGRRARRRTRVAAGAAAVAVVAVVAGAGALAVRPSGIGPAGDVVREGAIPSRITEPDGPVVTDLAIGPASVAYVAPDGSPVLVDATTGEAHAVELPDFPTPEVIDRDAELRRGPWLALSPDGRRVAYPTTQDFEREPGQVVNQTAWYRVVDLASGESDLVDLPPYRSTPLAMSWTTDGEIAVDVFGRPTSRPSATNLPPTISWTIDPVTGDSSSAPLTGLTAPGKGISAPFPTDDTPVRAVPFETATDTDPDRALPDDLYPDGAVVTPVGWADDSLLVVEVDAPVGSYVEGAHLALMTSPDRPESEWTYRILLRELPDSLGVSLAVDLVPDLDGTSSQELTHDFDTADEPPAPFGIELSLFIGLAVAAAIAVLLALRWLWRRLS